MAISAPVKRQSSKRTSRRPQIGHSDLAREGGESVTRDERAESLRQSAVQNVADDSRAPWSRQVRRSVLRQLLSEFLRAYDALATAPEPTLRGRLAYAATNVIVLHPESFPDDLRPRFEEFVGLLRSGRVPEYAQNHPRFARSHPVNYLSPVKARHAARLLIGLLESIAYELSFDT